MAVDVECEGWTLVRTDLTRSTGRCPQHPAQLLGGDADVDEAYREAFVLNANEADWASPRLPGGGDDSWSGGPAAHNRNTVPTSAPLARCNTGRWCCGMV